jgi:hypothetical protein
VHEALFRRLYENNTGNPIWVEGDPFPAGLDQWQQTEIVAAGHAYHFFSNARSNEPGKFNSKGPEILAVLAQVGT